VNPKKDIWYSFALEGGGAGGNILDFVARMEKTDILGAANLIADWFDVDNQEGITEEKNDAEEETEPSHEPDLFGAFKALLQDEINILESGAKSDIKDTLTGYESIGRSEIETVAERLSSWILRAYQRGYKLGKMQGAIEERVLSLSDREQGVIE
jgi:hypothetical protein